MHQKKMVYVLAITLIGFAIPFFSIPRANAFPTSFDYEQTGWLILGYFDSFYGTSVDAAREGSTINFQAIMHANGANFQRNLTVGVKFDWMTSWVNASNANPSSTLPLLADQIAIVTVTVALPTLTGSNANLNFATHDWELRVWNTKLNTAAGPTDDFDSRSRSNFALYSNAQADGILAKREARAKIDTLSGAFSSVSQLPPGSSTALADLSRANAELGLGDTSYSNGDFATAKTHYSNALNLVNSAVNSLSSTGGGVDTANYTNLIMSGTGFLLAGVGVILAGIGGFIYLNRRSKTQMMPRT